RMRGVGDFWAKETRPQEVAAGGRAKRVWGSNSIAGSNPALSVDRRARRPARRCTRQLTHAQRGAASYARWRGLPLPPLGGSVRAKPTPRPTHAFSSRLVLT